MTEQSFSKLLKALGEIFIIPLGEDVKNTFRIAAVVVATFLGTAAQSTTVDLIINGDFEAGNVAFTSDFAFSPANNTGAAQYTVDTDPKAWNGFFVSVGDNTTGTTNMMVVNGSLVQNDVVWSQTVNVNTNTAYMFEAWIADLFSGLSTVVLDINGTSLGSMTANAMAGIWEEHTFNWSSGNATTATISLLQGTTSFSGNDFALDDISFTTQMTAPPNPVPLPASFWLLGAGLAGVFGFRKVRLT